MISKELQRLSEQGHEQECLSFFSFFFFNESLRHKVFISGHPSQY